MFLSVALVGLGAGIISGLLGIGGGIVIVPALTVLLGLPIQQAMATSLAVIIPIALTGLSRYYFGSGIPWQIVAMIVPSAIVGSFFGSSLAQIIPAYLLKKIFALLMIFVAVQFLRD
jgi:uncharacterized protein